MHLQLLTLLLKFLHLLHFDNYFRVVEINGFLLYMMLWFLLRMLMSFRHE